MWCATLRDRFARRNQFLKHEQTIFHTFLFLITKILEIQHRILFFYHRTKNTSNFFIFVVEGMTPSRTGSDQKLCDTSESSDLDTRSGNSISWSEYFFVRCCQCSFWIKYCLFTINFFVWVS